MKKTLTLQELETLSPAGGRRQRNGTRRARDRSTRHAYGNLKRQGRGVIIFSH